VPSVMIILQETIKYVQWENPLHSEALWSNSFAQGAASQNNSLANCIRCHDGKGYVNFTKGRTTNTTGMVQAAMLQLPARLVMILMEMTIMLP
jgi:cytochrome c553